MRRKRGRRWLCLTLCVDEGSRGCSLTDRKKEVEKDNKRDVIIGVAVAAMLAPVMIAVTAGTEIKLWHILLAISFFFAILTFSYPLIRMMRKRRERREEERLRLEEREKSREEEVIEILKEIEELKKEMERRGIKLTSISDVFLVSVQILAEMRAVRYRIDELGDKVGELKEIIKGGNRGYEGSHSFWYCDNSGYMPHNNIITLTSRSSAQGWGRFSVGRLINAAENRKA